MDTQKAFDVLKIEVTKDEARIRAAYRDKLVSVNPEDNPEGFKRLREAYEEALVFARRREEDGAKDMQEDPVGLFLKKLEDIYSSLSRRLDPKEWEQLAREDVLDDLDLGEDAKWGLFSYLAKYYRMPARNWQILDRAFGIAQNEQEFKEHLNKNFVDFMLWKISDGEGSGDFTYERFSGEDRADYDAFLDHFDTLRNLMGQETAEDGKAWKREMEQEIAFLESLHISHPWFEMEKAKARLLMGDPENAEKAVRALWEKERDDLYMLLAGADILRRCGCEDEAAFAYEDALKKENLSDERIYTASVNLAEYYLKQEKLLEAREHALRSRRTYNTQLSNDLLDRVNEKLIDLYIGERAESLTDEEGRRLAWCLIQSNRSGEGWEFFKTHPVLEADTAECHWAKTVMALENGLAQEAAEQARQWRACILRECAATPTGENGAVVNEEAAIETSQRRAAAEEENRLSGEDGFHLAQSFKMEGRALQLIYNELEDKESEDAKRLYGAAMAAFDEAVLRQPEEMDFLMSKMLFLRDVHDYEQMAALCERMKELDDQFFWAYFYGQEAYEGLGRAQEVVDAFYDAKRIYAGKVEIYERAVKVFLAYRQYRDAKHIIDQAEEAGVNSFYLMLKKLEILRRMVTDAATLKEADAYAAQVIAEFEEKKAPDEQLAEAYLQRCFIQDDSRAKAFQSVDGIEQWAKRAVALDDNNRTRYFLGRFYLEYRDDAKRCYEHMKICERRGLDFAWMYFYIARCHEEFEQWEESLKYFKLAAQKDPEESDFKWRVVWRLRWKFNQTSQLEYCREALKYLEEQNEKFGETPRELWQASDLHAGLREYETALAEIGRALEHSPLSRNWGQKGFLLDMLKRPEEAFPCYEKGIAIDLEKGKDYAYGYTRIFEYFCEMRDYAGGLDWFVKTLGQLQTEKQRRKNLDRIKYFYIRQKRYDEALHVIEELYGGTKLTEYAGNSWEREGERITDLLDLYEYYFSPEDLEQKNLEAAALLEGEAADSLEESFEGKRRAYMELGYSYANYLLDDENGLFYFRKALEQIERQGEDADQSEYRTALEEIMKCLYRLGKADQTEPYRRRFLESVAKDYEDCSELGKTLEEMYAGAFGSERLHLYHMFCLCYYGGDAEAARSYAAQMECSKWCQWCRRTDCSEIWECRGLLALYDGKHQEAVQLFKQAMACATKGNSDVQRELRRLKKMGFE